MTLREYLKQLNELVKEKPEVLDYRVITSSDDEGNEYNRVHYPASIGNFEDEDREFNEEKPSNAVCLN